MNTKESVLRILQEAKKSPVSGELLAETIGVSRNSIWKAVNSLKNEGYNIDGKQKRGYILEDSNVLSVDMIKEFLTDKDLSDKIVLFSSIDSTNNAAKKYAVGEVKNSQVLDKIFIANEQTGGRGRLGREFYSPSNTGVYISFLFHPSMKAENAVTLTTAASVAVCRSIENVFEIDPKIKWVNDVYVGSKKVCGILTEAVTDFESGAVESVIVGIGVNVFDGNFPGTIKDIAGSLVSSDNIECDVRNRLLGEMINQVDHLIGSEIIKNSDLTYIEEYKERSMVLGKQIRIVNTGERADVLDIDETGGLVIELTNGEKRVLNTGEISIRLD